MGDLPFGSYEASPEMAVRSAVRLLKEGAMDAVKLEGASPAQSTLCPLAMHRISALAKFWAFFYFCCRGQYSGAHCSAALQAGDGRPAMYMLCLPSSPLPLSVAVQG